MKRTSIRLSDEHAAQIEATGKNASEIIQDALDLYFQHGRGPLARAEALMLVNAAISAHEAAQHHNKPSHSVPYRVTVKKLESSDFVAQQREAEGAEARGEATKSREIGVSVPQEGTTKGPPKKIKEAHKPQTTVFTPESVKRALAFIQSEFDAGSEPTPEQVSKAAGMDYRQLGKALSKLDIKSRSIHRGGRSFRIYPLASKARVWELASLDVEGLQKMAEERARSKENMRKHYRDHFTVFD